MTSLNSLASGGYEPDNDIGEVSLAELLHEFFSKDEPVMVYSSNADESARFDEPIIKEEYDSSDDELPF